MEEKHEFSLHLHVIFIHGVKIQKNISTLNMRLIDFSAVIMAIKTFLFGFWFLLNDVFRIFPMASRLDRPATGVACAIAFT